MTTLPPPVAEDFEAREVRDVSRSDIRKFAVAVHARDDAHYSVEAAHARGYPDLLAPAMFFTSLGLSLGRIRWRTDFDPAGLSHDDPLSGQRVVAGETRVDWSRDLFAGDVVTVEQRLLDRHERIGRSGRIRIYSVQRRYLVGDELAVREVFTRIAR